MAGLVIICPLCKTENDPTAEKCKECNKLLPKNLRPVPSSQTVLEEAPAHRPAQIPDPPAVHGEASDAQPRYVKICPNCGQAVMPNINECICGENLYGVLLSPTQEEAAPRPAQQADSQTVSASYILRSEDGRLELRLREDEEIIIGREGCGADYLAGKGFVARRHLRVLQKNGMVMITHISQTNPTLVNGAAIEPDKPYKVSDNDLIALGALEGQGPMQLAAYFRLLKI